MSAIPLAVPRLAPGRAVRIPPLVSVLAYRNDAVVARLEEELSLAAQDARILFDDVKRFLWLGAVTPRPIAPPPKIDDGWHLFILFTEDYAGFCHRYFGCFRHHRPRRPDDAPDGGAAVRRTVEAIRERFGGPDSLSANWRYAEDEAGAFCFGKCGVPSSNCQDPKCY